MEATVAFLTLDLRASRAGCTISADALGALRVESGTQRGKSCEHRPGRHPSHPAAGRANCPLSVSLFRSKAGGLGYERYFAFAPLEVKFPNESTLSRGFQYFSKQIRASRQSYSLSTSLPSSHPKPSRVCRRPASGILVSVSLTPGAGDRVRPRLPGCGDRREWRWALRSSRPGLGPGRSELRFLRVRRRWHHGSSRRGAEGSGEPRVPSYSGHGRPSGPSSELSGSRDQAARCACGSRGPRPPPGCCLQRWVRPETGDPATSRAPHPLPIPLHGPPPGL